MTPLAELLQGLPLEPADGGKDESGTAVVVGGPPTCPGAALLCAVAALRVGAGRVQAIVHPEVAPAAAASAWELLVDGWDQTTPPPPAILDRIEAADVVVIGPGHHRFDEVLVAQLAERATGAVVLDAGALAAAPRLGTVERLVLAPNSAEAARLAGTTGDEAALAKALVDELGRPVAVRGPSTVVADPTGSWRFDGPPPGLGTPGSGDVLVGVVAGLLATGCTDLAALGWAVQLHAAAGGICAERAPVGYLASELAAALPVAREAAAG